MKDYRLTVKVRNNRILKAIEASGGATGAKWCKANGLSYIRVNNLINMTESPIKLDGSLTSIALKLCDALNSTPDDLWSNEQLYPLERNFSEMEMSYEQVMAALPSEDQSYLPDFSDIENKQIAAIISSAIDTLSPRQKDVIKMRFYEEMTLEECGEKIGIHRERVRQIEAKALRSLRASAMNGNSRLLNLRDTP